jgi:hypothetical protein
MKRLVFMGVLAGVLAARAVFAQGTTTLGTVHIARTLMADGKPLPAGTYQVRLTSEELKAAVGQSPNGEQFVEFVKGGQVAGREVAIVVSAEEIGTIAKGARPKPGTSKVEMLKGGDYWRVWINKGGTNYILNLPPAS